MIRTINKTFFLQDIPFISQKVAALAYFFLPVLYAVINSALKHTFIILKKIPTHFIIGVLIIMCSYINVYYIMWMRALE